MRTEQSIYKASPRMLLALGAGTQKVSGASHRRKYVNNIFFCYDMPYLKKYFKVLYLGRWVLLDNRDVL